MSSFIGLAPYIVAEIGANHNGDMDLARKMIVAAKELGCDGVKFQSFDNRLFAKEIYGQNAFLGDGRDVANDLRVAVDTYSVDADQLRALRDFSVETGIGFSSSVFEPDQARELAALDPAFIKIASMDVTNDYLLREIAAVGKPLVLSTGMATLEEIAHAVETLEDAGNLDLTILHCVAIYPVPDDQINLNNMDMLADTFGYPVGFSDHSRGADVAIAAAAKGAVFIEKHFTLDRTLEGWDHAMSADPEEMSRLVEGVRRAHRSLGHYRRIVSDEERGKKDGMRRSIVSGRAIAAGTKIAAGDLTFRRPGTGLAPNLAPALVGLSAAHDIEEDVVLSLDDFGSAPGA